MYILELEPLPDPKNRLKLVRNLVHKCVVHIDQSPLEEFEAAWNLRAQCSKQCSGVFPQIRADRVVCSVIPGGPDGLIFY